ncbi:serine hydrolase [Saccharibacillus sp. CPCC 101409]|uniref:serine hydrolase domain-containing protein n=1 Tax=Saccharibacillus sp. CPCC 101409 TaxID=3058041 RepID=UPI002672D456|nr:serine hydrolase [Saccharibacillus sp. CPCC 101409]MDO3408619.1 serine hydrolase [Saccharibacillus sp. CPCC 101409]
MSTSVLNRIRPEEAGIDPRGILDFLDAVAEEKFELHSFMLLRRGEVAAEGWWAPHAPEDLHAMYSVSKSFTSTAVGLAIEEGLLTLEDRVADHAKDLLPANPHPSLLRMTVRDLLVMGTGQREDPLQKARVTAGSDWARTFLSAPVENEPGSTFSYSSGATYMLSFILQTLTGQKVADYLETRLFAPLGIERKSWQTSPQDVTAGGWGLKLSTEDLAKFGQLYLQRGLWNGERLIPEHWIQQATSKQIANGEGDDSDWTRGYGYQFWVCRHNAYRADGAFGQFCLVLPDQEAVIVFTSAISRTQELLNAVWTHLLPAMRSEPLPVGDAGKEAAARLRALAYEPEPAGEAPAGEDWSGRIYRLDEVLDGELAIRAVRLTAGEDGSVFAEFWSGAGEAPRGEAEIALRCGAGRWLRTDAPVREEASGRTPDAGPVYGAVSRPEAGTLTLEIRAAEEPVARKITFRFDGGSVDAFNSANPELGREETRVKGRSEVQEA